MILSIVVPTTIERKDLFKKLCLHIYKQIFDNNIYNEVELLWDEDNKEKSIGKKRQDLIEKAKGKYVVGIDSDDWVADDYVIQIINAIKSSDDVDHIGFLENCNIDGNLSSSIFSIKYKKWDTINNINIRCANPKSVIKRSKALEIGFEDIRFKEDRIFSEKVTQILQSEIFINKELYFYRYNYSDFNERYGLK